MGRLPHFFYFTSFIMNKEQNSIDIDKFYNCIAEKYDYIFPLSPQQKAFFDSEIVGKSILDIGSATGNLPKYLSERYDVTAIDISEGLIAKAKEKGVEIRNLNMLEIGKLGKKFDTVSIVGNTLPHLFDFAEVRAFLSAANEQLTPGGKLIIQVVYFSKFSSADGSDFLGSLPLIENDHVRFERYYYQRGEKIEFRTVMDSRHENSELLLNLNHENLPELLKETGFDDIRIFGGFEKSEFDKDRSFHLVVVCRKK